MSGYQGRDSLNPPYKSGDQAYRGEEVDPLDSRVFHDLAPSWVSSSSRAANSLGPCASTLKPIAAKRSETCGWCRALVASTFNLSMICGGVRAGARSPTHGCTTRPFI